VWEAIVSGRAIDDPSLLTQFFLITFAVWDVLIMLLFSVL
jgi:hypothetical protein